MTSDSGSAAEQLAHARLLDTGAQAAIYEWGPGRVLRLLPREASLAQLEREATVMRAAHEAGVPVPAVHEVFEIDGYPAMVMERIDGGPMLTPMLERPWRLLPLLRRFGEIQAQLHEVALPESDRPAGLLSLHEAAKRWEGNLDGPDAELEALARHELAQLPRGDRLLHGDYHPLNLLMRGGDPVVIDWPGAAVGPPEADIARTLVLVTAADPPNGPPVLLRLLGAFRKGIFIPGYRRAYRRSREWNQDLIDRWIVVRAIERLAEGPPEERPALLRMIEQRTS
jgi:aminoglycoside phosphotransferase (APT) family kinase protein